LSGREISRDPVILTHQKEANMTVWALVIYVGAAAGIVLLAFCAKTLSAPMGWKREYSASTTKLTVDIPSPGRYSLHLNRDKYWLLRGKGTLNGNVFPHLDFSVLQTETNQPIPVRLANSMSSLVASTDLDRRMNVRIGFFSAPSPGQYVITCPSSSGILTDDKILIRKYQLPLITGLSIAGIVIGFAMFVGGFIVATCMLTGYIS